MTVFVGSVPGFIEIVELPTLMLVKLLGLFDVTTTELLGGGLATGEGDFICFCFNIC